MCSKCVSVLAATEKVENIKKKQQQQIVEKCVGCALSSAVDVVPRSAAKISAGAAKKLFGKRSRPILKNLNTLKNLTIAVVLALWITFLTLFYGKYNNNMSSSCERYVQSRRIYNST